MSRITRYRKAAHTRRVGQEKVPRVKKRRPSRSGSPTGLNEFAFRFNRRFYPFNAFRSLLGLATEAEALTYAELYDGDWDHPGTTDGRDG